MYKVKKEKGHNQTLFLENTETGGTLAVGRMSMDILTILKDAKILEDGVSYTSEIEQDVTPEVAERLKSTTMRTTKVPKTKTQSDKAKLPKKELDPMALMASFAKMAEANEKKGGK